MAQIWDTIADETVLERYKVLDKLGRGAYGVVWKAVVKESQAVVAIKKCFDAFQSSSDAQRIFREVYLLISLSSHENIVSLLDVVQAESEDDVYLVFGYMESDLHQAIQRDTLQDEHKRYVAYQIFVALAYLHSAGVIHRDVKPANVLLNQRALAQLCDFGLARTLACTIGDDPGSRFVDPELTDYVGTRWYRAPEGLLKVRSYGPGFDIWGMGCIIGEMLRGKPVFPGVTVSDQIAIVMDLLGWPSPEDLSACSVFAMRTLESLPGMRERPAPRPFASLFPGASNEALDLLRCCFCFNANSRISAAVATRHPYVVQFHNASAMTTFPHCLELPDGQKLTAREYRTHVESLIARVRNAVSRGEQVSQAPATSQAVTAVDSATHFPAPSLGPLAKAAARILSGSSVPQHQDMLAYFSFSDTAVALAHHLFLWSDRNHNGVLDKREFLRVHEVFVNLISVAFPDAPNTTDAGDDFVAVDQNCNEVIDEGEWMHYMSALFEGLGSHGFLQLKRALAIPNAGLPEWDRPLGPPGRFAFRPTPRVSFVDCPAAICQTHRLYQLVHGARPREPPTVTWNDFERLVVRPEARFFLGIPASVDDTAEVDLSISGSGPFSWLRQPDEALWMTEMGSIFEKVGSHHFLKRLDQVFAVLVVCVDDGLLSDCSTSRSLLPSLSTSELSSRLGKTQHPCVPTGAWMS